MSASCFARFSLPPPPLKRSASLPLINPLPRRRSFSSIYNPLRRSLPRPQTPPFSASMQSRIPRALFRRRPSSISFARYLGLLGGGDGPRGNGIRSMATEGIPEEIVPRSVPVRVANELLQAGHRYLDVRTVDEFNTGRPAGATNIPYMLKVGSGMTKNPKFLEEVSSVFGKDDEILIGCQSGRRSLMAATDLSFAGFTGVTDIAGGYSAWVQNGLPTEQ